MKSSCRGQPLARHTKVVDHSAGCVKAGVLDEEVIDSCYDDMSPNPLSRSDMSNAPQSKVLTCDRRCKTCVHIVVTVK